VLAFGCSDDSRRTPAWREKLPPDPHVVLYLIDTLRADHLGCYGYPHATSPFFDALAEESALFENAFSQGPWTVPSVASLMTSSYTSVHRMINVRQKLPESATTIAEFMRDAGYQTVGFTQSPFSGSLTGLDQGYAELVERPMGEISPEQRAQGVNSLRPFFEGLANWNVAQPTYVYIHTVEPHWPLNDLDERFFDRDEQERARKLNRLLVRFRELSRVSTQRMSDPEAYQEELGSLKETLAERRDDVVRFYDKAVQLADAHLESVVVGLEETGVWRDTVFIVIADHGEELLDHGSWLHDQSLHDELVHVPMLVRIPGVTDGGLRVSAAVQLIDLGPTLAELVDRPRPEGWQGRSILPLIAGLALEGKETAFTERMNPGKYDQALQELRGDRETAVVRSRWKLIEHPDVGSSSLYDRESDPGESDNLVEEKPDLTRALQDEIDLWREGLAEREITEPSEVEPSPEVAEQLRRLGYIDRSPRGR